jgi:hypothetical protein
MLIAFFTGRQTVSTLTISGKTIGARKPLFADWSLPIPPQWQGEGGITLRELIGCVVRSEVEAFRQRQEQRQVFRALTARQISDAATKGKIESGGSEVPLQAVDENEAVAIAWQAFEDGLYLVVIDGQDQRDLDGEIHLQPDTRVTFVRLTLLAGG